MSSEVPDKRQDIIQLLLENKENIILTKDMLSRKRKGGIKTLVHTLFTVPTETFSPSFRKKCGDNLSAVIVYGEAK